MTLFKSVLVLVAIAALTLSDISTVNAQGFRIGNFIRAGNGQGFRMGGPRAGMHFGGGQGASIGTQRFGMRFGNGQGARFGGPQYGMQFGGQQGTQIGRFRTTPSVVPGTYYYGNTQAQGYARQVVPQQRVVRSTPSRVVVRSSAIPVSPIPQTGVVQAQAHVESWPPQSASTIPVVSPTVTAKVATATQHDIARQPTTVSTSANTTVSTAANPGLIQLSYPVEATDNMEYTLNGNEMMISPGQTVVLVGGQDWTIRFSAGDEFSDRQAVLSQAGGYRFMKSPDEGWVLVNAETPATDAATPEAETTEVDVPEANAVEVDTAEVDTAEVDTPELVAPKTTTSPDGGSILQHEDAGEEAAGK